MNFLQISIQVFALHNIAIDFQKETKKKESNIKKEEEKKTEGFYLFHILSIYYVYTSYIHK